MGPLRLGKAESGNILLEGDSYFSRYRAGDKVDIVCTEGKLPVANDVSIETVIYPELGRIRMQLKVSRSLQDLDPLKDYFFYPSDSTVFNGLIIKRLKANSHAPNLLTGLDNVGIQIDRLTEHGLNATQLDAFKTILDRNFISCVQGPPGTGKTQLLKSLLLSAASKGLRIGLTAFTHSAIDNALARILDGHKNLKFARVGRAEKIRSHLYSDPTLVLKKSYDTFKLVPSTGITVFAGTMHAWVLSTNAPIVDLLIVDEASQVPPYFLPFLTKMAKSIVMFGDHKQLPPVRKSQLFPGEATDAFSAFMALHPSTPMLELQYRMNQDIQDWSSSRFYERRLRPDESNRDRDILRGRINSPLVGDSPVSLFEHSHPSVNNSNQAEASTLVDIIAAVHKDTGLGLENFAVVTPHRTQAGLVNSQLFAKFGIASGATVLVDTVERLQGQEREVVFLSIGADKLNKSSEDFLGDPRRLNVAATRARSRFFVMCSGELKKSESKSNGAMVLKDLIGWAGEKGKTNSKKAS
jgi:DNA replication ATP-dependent helicase Dna2